MCGICGILSPDSIEALTSTARAMSDTLGHRGPDAEGIWSDRQESVALGHRRLSILDLSSAGAQPMTSSCRRYVIVFNGEIYNHLALRAELEREAPEWHGNSDTETLLVAISHWGLQVALRRSHGMFAVALWDRREKRLYFARDRMGQKPLYLARLSGGWAFASELKALLAIPGFDARLCRNAIAAYLAYGYVPETQCIFQQVQKVSPGHIMYVSLEATKPEIYSYETFQDLVSDVHESRKTVDDDSIDGLEEVLGTVVEEQMLSDVPLGCFLSGGIDSSLVAALMQTRSAQKVRTFAIGFSEERFNEAPHAAAVAQHLGTDHTEIILSEQDALEVIANLPKIYDEPFADSSQIPTALLCREARKSVTVALTGDGGDEVFGGYNRHIIGPRLLSRLQRVPQRFRRRAGRVISACASSITAQDGWLHRLTSKMQLPVTALDKAVILAPHLGDINDIQELYEHFTRSIRNPESLLLDSIVVKHPELLFPVEGAEWMMAMDSMTYLPGDILAKVDRASMAASLETRTPFLDFRVVTAAWKLPLEMKISNGKGKQALRLLLDRHVPRDLIERPKQGFAIPIDRWLRCNLRSWAEELLSNTTLLDQAGLEPAVVNELWNGHQLGTENNGTKLWIILMLLDWLSHYRHFIIDLHAIDNEAAIR